MKMYKSEYTQLLTNSKKSIVLLLSKALTLLIQCSEKSTPSQMWYNLLLGVFTHQAWQVWVALVFQINK